MFDIITCFKWVIDEAYLRTGPAGELDLRQVNYKISAYDRNALEEAVRIREKQGGSVVAVTVGTPEAAKGMKDALSRGPDRGVFISDASFHELEPAQTASILAHVIGAKIKYDLIICGEGSGDLYAQQVGPRLAESLGIPCISFVQRLTLEGRRIIAERKVEEGLEVTAASLPALVTVLPDINIPRIPGVKDTLMAAKKQILTIGKQEIAAPYAQLLQTTGLRAAGMERNCVKFGADAAGVEGFVAALIKEGVLR